MTGSLIFAQEQTISPVKRKDKTFLKLTNVLGVANQVMDNMINSYQTYYKQVPAEYWNELKRKRPVQKTSKSFLFLYIPNTTQKKNWMTSLLSIKHLLDKSNKTMPDMTKESMQAGQEWGMKLGQKVKKLMKNILFKRNNYGLSIV